MRSTSNLSDIPGGLPLLADDVIEFHAARIILLIDLCGKNGRIEGLTKLAKLDFFVRYPGFFSDACTHLGKECVLVEDYIDSAMVRYHYGPWDRRYYQILGYLEARSLLIVSQVNSTFVFSLTSEGKSASVQLKSRNSFKHLVHQMRQVKLVLSSKNGNTLKQLIYQLFDQEIGRKKLGKVITYEH